MLEERADRAPDALAFRFLHDGEREEACWTYGELAARARSIAAALRGMGAEGRALLLYPPGLDYVAAFFGCLYAGVVAVPAYPPDPSRLHRTLPRLQAILADSGASVALTTEVIRAAAGALFAGMLPADTPLRWLATDTLGTADTPPPAEPHHESVAFIQYTSGSTASPRGVVLDHGNLLHNIAAVARVCGAPPGANSVVWLPPYHDMGLIGGILAPVFMGCPATLLSPLHFLQRPLRWLQAMSRYRATFSAGPNFAYELCVKKTTPEERAALDLSSWCTSFDGAEPISAAGLRRFAEAFAPAGFRLETFFPCYGLAEATLIATGRVFHEPGTVLRARRGSVERGRVERAAADNAPADAVEVVSCGPSISGQRVVIADPETLARRADGEVGEIWLSGPSVARGYWNQPDETRATFGARLAGSDEGPFLRTGDLGFLLEGDLFVTGRIKDLIIIAGQNFYPQDLERSAEASHPAVRVGASAAFSVPPAEDGGDERAVLVLEVDGARGGPELAEIQAAVRAAVARDHSLKLHDVVVVGRNAVPRTSSGKVQRHVCRRGYLEGTLQA